MKPREFWIAPNPLLNSRFFGVEKLDEFRNMEQSQVIHVIEYRAYEQLTKDFDGLVSENEDDNRVMQLICKERDDLIAEQNKDRIFYEKQRSLRNIEIDKLRIDLKLAGDGLHKIMVTGTSPHGNSQEAMIAYETLGKMHGDGEI